MENEKENMKKSSDESPIPMVILLITIGLGAISLVYFVLFG
jgi:VIT1/CCC1 family predicted Fe2+/Mn2+ transporter